SQVSMDCSSLGDICDLSGRLRRLVSEIEVVRNLVSKLSILQGNQGARLKGLGVGNTYLTYITSYKRFIPQNILSVPYERRQPLPASGENQRAQHLEDSLHVILFKGPLRYQHSLGTPDLRQTLPNLKTFLEHGLMVRCDRHNTSSAIPVPKRPASSTFAGHDIGFSSRTPTPEKGPRKRASSENERMQYRTPPPSYKAALAEPIAILVPATPADKGHFTFSSLDASTDSSKGNTRKDFSESLNGDSLATTDSHGRSQAEHFSDSPSAVNGTFLQNESMEFVSEAIPCAMHASLSGDLHCAVEQAEEILGTEASDFTSGDQLEAFNSIPVDRAVAVECDDQVLGEFEEFSRRIYALNENMSSFRRPRKSSDK
ncbi:UV radiation resistance-associated gene protein, partial [Dendropsophus ebraccatus]|uniref:UV radiation resistance-associated gene protein n=1 Tax=Dendropsophus ebraccatus TaxID=150705 RepID=UPI003831752C